MRLAHPPRGDVVESGLHSTFKGIPSEFEYRSISGAVWQDLPRNRATPTCDPFCSFVRSILTDLPIIFSFLLCYVKRFSFRHIFPIWRRFRVIFVWNWIEASFIVRYSVNTIIFNSINENLRNLILEIAIIHPSALKYEVKKTKLF